MATRIIRKHEQKVVEITYDEFKSLTAELTNVSPLYILEGIEIEAMTTIKIASENPGNTCNPLVIKTLNDIRNKLNLVETVREIEQLFKTDEGFTRIEDDTEEKPHHASVKPVKG